MGKKKKRFSREEIAGLVKAIDRMVEEGTPVELACEKLGIHKSTYYRWRKKLQSENCNVANPLQDPDEKEDEGVAKVETKSNHEIAPSEEVTVPVPSKVQESYQRLEEYLKEYKGGEEEHPLVQATRNLLDEVRKTERALMQVYQVLGVKPSSKPEKAVIPETLPDLLKVLGEQLKKLEEQRKAIKQILEQFGFKVEDKYVPREEVDRMIEEAKQQVVDEAYDEAKIKVVERVAERVIDRLTEIFQPMIQAWWSTVLATQQAQQSASQTTQPVQPQSQHVKVADSSKVEKEDLEERLGLKTKMRWR